MRLSEKGVLASLTLMLLAFSVAAETRIIDGRVGASQASSWEAEIGLYLPFVLFALVSTYHFLDWARKHRKQAILLGIVVVSVASLLGVGAANTPRPSGDTMSLPARPLTISQPQTSRGSGGLIQQLPSFQDSLMQLQNALNSTPYYSTGANALVLLASLAALVFVLLKVRRERPTLVSQQPIRSLTAEPLAESPREAVIQSYRLACMVLQATGLRIPESDTPLDIYARTEPVKPRIANSLWRLTMLFEEAKFSLHTMTETEAEQANSFLDAIRINVSSS